MTAEAQTNTARRCLRCLPPGQAARILNVCDKSIARMCEFGELKAVRVRSVWRINRDALLDFAGLK